MRHLTRPGSVTKQHHAYVTSLLKTQILFEAVLAKYCRSEESLHSQHGLVVKHFFKQPVAAIQRDVEYFLSAVIGRTVQRFNALVV